MLVNSKPTVGKGDSRADLEGVEGWRRERARIHHPRGTNRFGPPLPWPAS